MRYKKKIVTEALRRKSFIICRKIRSLCRKSRVFYVQEISFFFCLVWFNTSSRLCCWGCPCKGKWTILMIILHCIVEVVQKSASKPHIQDVFKQFFFFLMSTWQREGRKFIDSAQRTVSLWFSKLHKCWCYFDVKILFLLGNCATIVIGSMWLSVTRRVLGKLECAFFSAPFFYARS